MGPPTEMMNLNTTSCMENPVIEEMEFELPTLDTSDLLTLPDTLFFSEHSIPPSASEHEVPPSASELEVPPSTSELGVPPSTSELEVPPSTSELGVPPSTSELEVPPSTSELGVPPSTSELEVPPSTSELGVPPSTSELGVHTNDVPTNNVNCKTFPVTSSVDNVSEDFNVDLCSDTCPISTTVENQAHNLNFCEVQNVFESDNCIATYQRDNQRCQVCAV